MQKFLTARKVVGVVSGSSTPVYLRGALSRNVRFERGRGFSAVPTQNETASTDPKPEHEGGTITELEAEGIPSPPPSKGPVRILNARVRNPLSIKRATAKSDRRQQYIDENIATIYPRLDSKETSELLPYETIRGEILKMQPGTSRDDLTIVVRGRVRRIRDGGKVLFFDLTQNGDKIQVMYNFPAILEKNPAMDIEEVRERASRLTRIGDIVSVTGHIGRTSVGEATIHATEAPKLLSPCLHVLPTNLADVEKRNQYRHVDLLIRPVAGQILRLRSDIIQYLRGTLLKDGFTEVQTPIISDAAGGASARPFTTTATIFPEKRLLTLRIAPELWLKKLVIGGLDKVFEIGTQFRNEGADFTHNPEFTTCEFYRAYVGLEELMTFTEALFQGLAERVTEAKKKYSQLPEIDIDFKAPFKRIRFIPALEEAMGRQLPKLENNLKTVQLLEALFQELHLELPDFPTIPRLLDELSSIYLEPKCEGPTFITHHPECLSPLAKSTITPDGQRVSERMELFVGGKELVNAYEEENSPFEQRRKLLDQRSWKNETNSAFASTRPGIHTNKLGTKSEELADEAYIAALEWGLPPTGGWGMGIDRVCMLFSGTNRINDVLAFGGLRGVVGQGGLLKSNDTHRPKAKTTFFRSTISPGTKASRDQTIDMLKQKTYTKEEVNTSKDTHASPEVQGSLSRVVDASPSSRAGIIASAAESEPQLESRPQVLETEEALTIPATPEADLNLSDTESPDHAVLATTEAPEITPEQAETMSEATMSEKNHEKKTESDTESYSDTEPVKDIDRK